MIGFDSGSTTDQRNRKSLDPSSWAASSSSSGMESAVYWKRMERGYDIENPPIPSAKTMGKLPLTDRMNDAPKRTAVSSASIKISCRSAGESRRVAFFAGNGLNDPSTE